MKKIDLNYNGLSGQVYIYIKKMILSGEFQAGHKIHEEKVGQLFGVSRTPIRESPEETERVWTGYAQAAEQCRRFFPDKGRGRTACPYSCPSGDPVDKIAGRRRD